MLIQKSVELLETMRRFFQKVRLRAKSLERRYLNDPILGIPELASRITPEMQRAYGQDAINCQVIAENLLFGVQYIVGAAVEGHVAEFGTATGRTASVLSAAIASFGGCQELHLFDSFEGLPESTSEVDRDSIHVMSGVWDAGQCRGISPDALKRRCAEFLSASRVRIYEGWFSETFKQVPGNIRFALLHIDCDLYQSAMDVMDHVFRNQQVSEGALILFDDWNCNRGSPDHGERKAWKAICETFEVSYSDLGSYGWAGYKFLVHGYKGMKS